MQISAVSRARHGIAARSLATWALALVSLGCATAPAPPLPTRQASANRRAPLTPNWLAPRDNGLDAEFATPGTDPRAGSAPAQAARPAASTPVDPRALNDVMAQLRLIGAADPGVQAKLMDDLQRTDPSLWPLVIETYRSSLAYQSRTAAAGAGPAGSATTAASGATQTIVAPTAPTAAAPQSGQAAQLSPQKSPWGALAVPGITQADQVVLKDSSQQPVGSPTAATVTGNPTAASDPSGASPPASAPPSATATSSAISEPPLLQAAATGAVTQAVYHEGIDRGSGAASGATGEQVSFSTAATSANSAAVLAAISTLEQQCQAQTRDAADISRQACLRMLYLAAGRRQDALRPIEGVSPAEQDYWNNQMASLATWLDVQTIPDAGARAAAAHGRLTEAANRLAELSPLALRNLAFCTEVASYGVITRFGDNVFAPGTQVLLYAEIENFKSESTPKGFHTALKSSYQILDKQGNRVGGAEPQSMEEDCQNARRDYFVRYRLSLPKPLADGVYSLQLAVEDTLSRKTAKSSIEFTIKEKK